mmetsp:Transcript_34949/g.68983  ORF Transcript_34949/g.68983 Transcript_34949/m.68983 type:complete len:125 (-) Transcript_34949:100-474(-)
MRKHFHPFGSSVDPCAATIPRLRIHGFLQTAKRKDPPLCTHSCSDSNGKRSPSVLSFLRKRSQTAKGKDPSLYTHSFTNVRTQQTGKNPLLYIHSSWQTQIHPSVFLSLACSKGQRSLSTLIPS